MPENLASEPSLKPLLDAKHRKRKKLSPQHSDDNPDGVDDAGTSIQDTLWK